MYTYEYELQTRSLFSPILEKLLLKLPKHNVFQKQINTKKI